MKKEKIAIILVSPENPDNIGAVARAVKNMGFADLRLVSPPRAWRAKAKKMAMSASDILKKGKAYASLQDAIQDLGVVIGTTGAWAGIGGLFFLSIRRLQRFEGVHASRRSGLFLAANPKALKMRTVPYAITW